MDEGQIFIQNMLQVMSAKGMSEAELSKKANLNRRAVTDMREGRVKSPKLSTVFSISRALDCDPGEMMGLGSRVKIREGLAEALAQYPAEEQERLEHAFRARSADKV